LLPPLPVARGNAGIDGLGFKYLVLKTVLQDVLHAFQEWHVICCKIKLSARNKRVVNTLQKKPPLGICSIYMIILRRVGEQIIGCSDSPGPQERQHDIVISVYKFDVIKLKLNCITDCAVKRFSGCVDADDVAAGIFSGSAARQNAMPATEVNLQRVIVAEQIL